ncbi:TonB family protein [Marinobacter sp. 1_MG-2023]|uniref:TonB family protein n=1 Tax=Marinobacter sp. 1_MG-2023 TaxID=3062627 RepID=UPI0026E2F844|nr:TonB family protein [Marinobacter sp. 1_MG-2023]MDO6823951.1 TonB family protein [Marinobacter sp. 1_MG-2023]
MLEHGSNNSLPAKYRIALALSTAFLIHTLLLSGIPYVVPDPPVNHRQQLELELVAAGIAPETAPSVYTTDRDGKNLVRNPPFEATPDQSEPSQQKPVLTANRSEQKTTAAELAKPATPSRPAHKPSKSGARKQSPDSQSKENTTRITQSPSEQDPYLIKLAMHLATQLESRRIPAIRELTHSHSMEMELRLLGNGALTRVRVIKSTGIEQIDTAAYRAALAASPYPEPPPDENGKSRFEVKLVFAPSRL